MTMTFDERAESAPAGRGAVLLIDDHRLISQGLSLALRGECFHAVVAPDVSLDTALEQARLHRPVLALVDLHFGKNPLGGRDLIAPLTAGGTRVLVVSGSSDAAIFGSCLEVGAVGVADKAEPFDQLFDRIDRALRGEPANTPREREDFLAAWHQRRVESARTLAPFESLSARERVVLDQLARGLAAEAIAETSFVSLATVRSQIQAILRKLDVTSQLAAVARVHESGWVLESL
jgi:two-component system, NarL family, nitrate/nitrite response regulator NarL